jgi:hypothetical protein
MKPESKRKRANSPEKNSAVGGQAVNVPGADSGAMIPVPVGSVGGVGSRSVILAPVGSGGGVDSGAVILAPAGSGGSTPSGAVIPGPVGSGGDEKAPANIQTSPVEGVSDSNEVVFSLGTHNKDERRPPVKATANPKKLHEERTDKDNQHQLAARKSISTKLRLEGATTATAEAPEPVSLPLLAPSSLTDCGHVENSPSSGGGCQTDDSALNNMLIDVQTNMQEHMHEGEFFSTTAGCKIHKNLFQTIQMYEFR